MSLSDAVYFLPATHPFAVMHQNTAVVVISAPLNTDGEVWREVRNILSTFEPAMATCFVKEKELTR